MSQNIAAIILAAGMSQRMGQPKLLLPFGDRPMLARIIETLTACADISQILVVTGHYKQEISALLRDYSHVQAVHNPEYATGGMLSSVKIGVEALTPDTSAFFLALGDQPAVQPATLSHLSDTWRTTHAPIVLPTLEGKRGHPVLFAAALAPEIRALPEDATLKVLITRYSEELYETPVSDPAIGWDIDTPEEYERALRRAAF